MRDPSAAIRRISRSTCGLDSLWTLTFGSNL